jgi:hypothetical protein
MEHTLCIHLALRRERIHGIRGIPRKARRLSKALQPSFTAIPIDLRSIAAGEQSDHSKLSFRRLV